jgi:hypothetical protein
MSCRHVVAIALLAVLALAPAASARPRGEPVAPVWRAVPHARTTAAKRAAVFRLAAPRLRAALAGAPRRAVRRAAVLVSVPAPDGTLERFRVVQAPVMAAGRARRASGFHGFAGVGVDDPSATLWLDYSVLGAHASVRGAGGTFYVDPDAHGRYVSYYGRDELGASPHSEREGRRYAPRALHARALPTPGAAVIRRTYRLALASDPSYAASVSSAGDDAATVNAKVSAAKQTLISRVDQVYGDDLGVNLVLVAGNSALNFNTASAFTTAYTSAVTNCYSSNAQALAQNQTVVDNAIGSANYDIGHLAFGPDGDGGGIADLGVVGHAGVKAQGCTGLSVPYGDFFAIDYVAHEMGHEFGGDHTFDGTTNSCGGGNRNQSTSVEPGSGSSIMAYAGICGNDDLQSHSDPYFSERSIQEIQTYITANATQGGTPVTTANHSPVVGAPAPVTIPVQTPFTLTGSATDADGDSLVYTWEQNDPGQGAGTLLTSNAKPSGPLFRQFSFRSAETDADAAQSPAPGENAATAEASRTFPDPAQIAAGDTDQGGSCSTVSGAPTPAQIDCYSEYLPTPAWVGTGGRAMHFRLTARDRFLTGGGASSADVTVTTSGSTPFAVTSQGTATALPGDAPAAVTWNVAGTTAAPFNVAAVKISYSTDGGLTFPTVLAASTPNDGSESVTVPNAATTAGRFKVEAIGNVFFDVNHADLTVTASGATPTPTPTATATATPTATPTVTATATATAPVGGGGGGGVTATATPTADPTASPTPTPTPTPTLGPPLTLTPTLSAVSKRLRVRRHRVRVTLGCTGTVLVCDGTATLTKSSGRRIGSAKFSFPTFTARKVTLRLSHLGRAHHLQARLRVTVAGITLTKRIRLRIA